MTDEERKKLYDCSAKYAIIGYLKENGRFDAAICVSDLDFEKEKNKFELYRIFKLTEIHKR